MTRRQASTRLGARLVFRALLGSAVLAASIGPRGAAGDPPPKPPAPAANSREEARVELGRRLFFDPAVSRSGVRSCASCHDPEHGYSDPQRSSDDDILFTRRHSQTLIDTFRSRNAHWDGEFDSIEELVDARLGLVDGVPYGGSLSDLAPSLRGLIARRPRVFGPDGTGLTPDGQPTDDARPLLGMAPRAGGRVLPEAPRDPHAARVIPFDATRLPEAAGIVEAEGRYREAVLAVYETDRITTARLSEMLSDYVRNIHSTPGAFDRYVGGDEAALTPSELRGLALFRGRAGCAQCHSLEGAKAPLTDLEFHNTGIEWRTQSLASGSDTGGVHLEDPGRALVTTASGDRRAFKTPTLRHVGQRGPFMHDGSLATLPEVVRHYAGGGSKDPLQDPRLRGFEVTDQEVQDLVAFLGTLTGKEIPGRAQRPWSERAARTRVKLVDARGRALQGWAVELLPDGDLLPGNNTTRACLATSDEDGRLEITPSARTHTRLVLPGGLVPLGGPLVPDTCRDALVRVPVDGTVRLVLRGAADAAMPPELVAEHEGTMRIPGHTIPRSRFRHVGEVRLPEGVVASYEAWMRTDVPPDVILRLPGERSDAKGRRLVLRAGKVLEVDLRR